jgi:putative heme-binding domain-containing protein
MPIEFITVPGGSTERPFPQTLSETGLFSSVRSHEAAPGVVPFAVNAEQWSDHAVAERLVAIPESGSVLVRPRPTRIAGSQFVRAADFPRDSVLVKTLSLDMESGKAESRRRIETQILHYDGRDWLGYTYAWNDDQSDATLVDRDGEERVFMVRDAAAPAGQRTRSWRFSARSECLRCHNPWSEHTLAFNLAQLNRPVEHAGETINQITHLEQLGVLESDPVPNPDNPFVPTGFLADPARIPRLASPFDTGENLQSRARSYLHVNCSHCHRFNGGGSARIYLTHDLKLRDTLAVAVPPTQGSFGVANAELIAPGDPCRSIVYFRLAKTGPGHMPHLGAREVDERGLALVHDWIRQIPVRFGDTVQLEKLVELDEQVCLEKERESRPFAEWRDARRRAREQDRDDPNEEDRVAAREWIDRKFAEAAELRATKRQELVAALLGRPEAALLLVDAVRRETLPPGIRGLVLDSAGGPLVDAAIRDLFETFLPEEQRTKRLGESFDSVALLAVSGDATRGEKLFHESTVVQCRNCHRVGTRGMDLGPALDAIGRKYDRAKLLESIVHPSKEIDPRYANWLISTTAGTVHTGLLVERSQDAIVLRDAENRRLRIPADEVEDLVKQSKSLMPELQLRDFTAEQAADLLAYLTSLRAELPPVDAEAAPASRK